MLILSMALALSAGAFQRPMDFIPPPAPPLCTVTAVFSPLWWNRLTLNNGLPAVMSVSVALKPDCPPNGHADVFFDTGVRLVPEDGPYTLTPDAPSVTVSGVPGYWMPRWRAASGLLYTVPWLNRGTQ